MSIITNKDTLKLNISKRGGIGLIVLSSFTLLSIIVANIYWLAYYNLDSIKESLVQLGKEVTSQNLDAYVRMKAIFSIVGNTLIIGLFAGMVWWSMNKKRVGLAFGIFWIIVFGGNAISTPFYAVQLDAFSIISLVLYVGIAAIMLAWLSSLIAYRQRLRVAIARKG